MPFLEIFEAYLIPAGGLIGGLTDLIVFFLTKSNREAERKRIDAEIEKILTERDEIRAQEKKDLQEFWHREFNRLNARIDELEAEKQGQDLTIKELTAENAELKKVQVAQEKDLKEKDRIIRLLEGRIRALENLLKRSGIDPDGDTD